MLMVYMGTGHDDATWTWLERSAAPAGAIKHGWTLLTAVNLMLFSLLHNPCATTIMTIYKETLSAKWATIGALMPLALAFIVTFVVAVIWRAIA